MATLTKTFRPKILSSVMLSRCDLFIEKILPRRCMTVSVGLILAGLSLPALMAIQLLPVTLLLGFVSLALIAIGGTLALVFCGEI